MGWSRRCPVSRPHRRRRAGIVYGHGLRRYLIIFAPHTLVLDRWTHISRTTPPPQLIEERSKNFTSGVSISSTPKGPIASARRRPPAQAPAHHRPRTGRGGPGGARRHVAHSGRRDQQNTGTPARSIHCHPMREHAAIHFSSHGCLGRAELFTVTTMGGSGGGD